MGIVLGLVGILQVNLSQTSFLLIEASWSGLGFLALFMAGRLNVLDTRGQVWKTVLCLIPLTVAAFIAVSRLMDNR